MRGQALGASAVQLSVGSAGQFRRYGEQGPPSRGSGSQVLERAGGGQGRVYWCWERAFHALPPPSCDGPRRVLGWGLSTPDESVYLCNYNLTQK